MHRIHGMKTGAGREKGKCDSTHSVYSVHFVVKFYRVVARFLNKQKLGLKFRSEFAFFSFGDGDGGSGGVDFYADHFAFGDEGGVGFEDLVFPVE